MGGKKNQGQESGKGREEQEHMRRPGQDPVHPETGRGKTPEELRRRQAEMRREQDEKRDEEP
ncbi:hypothetical protein ABZZ20_21050 [Streptomyces sp. NPDC006430]|uniref:hypothetical protein n=1 Tax=Streptomyces sp. NPDC006430 TaxID=3154299 RepID=UPI0033AABD7F